MVKIDISEKTYECLMAYLKGESYTKEQLKHLFEAPGTSYLEDFDPKSRTVDDVVWHLLNISYSEGL